MKIIRIQVEVRKYVTVETEVSDHDYYALKNSDPEDIIPDEIKDAVGQAEQDYDQHYYDYRIFNANTGNVLVDTGTDFSEVEV